MWKSVSPLYRDRGCICILRSGARRRRHVTRRHEIWSQRGARILRERPWSDSAFMYVKVPT